MVQGPDFTFDEIPGNGILDFPSSGSAEFFLSSRPSDQLKL